MKLLVWGTGNIANQLFESNKENVLQEIEIVGFIDNDRRKECFHDIKVYKPEEIKDIDFDYIDIWTINGYYEILHQIKKSLMIPQHKIVNIFNNIIVEEASKYKSDGNYIRPTTKLFDACIDYYRIHQWYKSVYKDFVINARLYLAYEWICENVGKNSSILDIACGPGEVLFYLREAGFENLYGYDIYMEAIATAIKIDMITNGNIHFFVDNACMPSLLRQFDVMLWMSGMYLIPGYELTDFFDSHLKYLNDGGYLIFEIVDSAYNSQPLNQYHTQDWKLDEDERRKSEYRFRMSQCEVEETALKYGLDFIDCLDVKTMSVPFKIYVLRK